MDSVKVPPPDMQMDNFSSTAQLTRSKDKAATEKTALSYDPFLERDTTNTTSDAGAMAHLLKSSLGSGILAMPNAFKHSGLAFGMVATLVVGYICTHTVHILVRCSQVLSARVKVPCLGFAETAEQAFETGPVPVRKYSTVARNFVNAALIATYYSALCVYVVFIAESLQQVFPIYLPGMSEWNIRYYMALLLLPLALLSLVPNLKYLVPFSALANAFIVVSFAITLYYMFTDMPSPDTREQIVSADKLPLFFSTVIFAMEGIGMVLPVENTMKNPRRFLGCPGVLNIAMGIVVGLYAVIGFFGYLKYGNDTQGSVTLNLPTNEWPAQVVKILIALAMILTYGLQTFVPTDIVLGMLKPHVSQRWKVPFDVGYRLFMVFLTVGIAAAVPTLGPIISLVGAVFVSTLGLFCPAVIETVVFWEKGLGRGNWRLYKNILIVAFSLFALVTGTYTSVLEIIEKYTST